VKGFWRVLLATDAMLKEFWTRFVGKASPVHFFRGCFDLAVTRFRAAGRPTVMVRYHCSCACRAAQPQGNEDSAGTGVFLQRGVLEFPAVYDDLRASAGPRATLLELLQSTYKAAVTLGQWDRQNLSVASYFPAQNSLRKLLTLCGGWPAILHERTRRHPTRLIEARARFVRRAG
jgi:hypothetical protein